MSPEELCQWYLVEGLTDAEIATRAGTSQARINRLRHSWGIPTRSRQDRLNLPGLTSRQKALLLGSLLGDGRLFRTGPATAAYSEFHCTEQNDYLDWKVAEWGPHVKSLRPTKKTVRGKTFTGSIFRLHANSDFYPIWEATYPSGRGFKQFDHLDLSGFDGLSLAVWYLDDGGPTSNGYARFAVTPRQGDHAVLVALLSQMGIQSEVHSAGGWALWIHDQTSMDRFLDLVTPHIPACMAHKIPLPRRRGSAPRDRLSLDFLRAHAEKGVSWLAEASGVSVSTVKRLAVKEGLSLGTSQNPSEAWDLARASALSPMAEGDLVRLLVDLPLPPPPSEDEVDRDWRALCANSSVKMSSEGLISGGGRVGLTLCHSCFPYRYEGHREGRPSVREAWSDPTWVRRAIQYQEKRRDPLLPRNVFSALRALVQSPSNFRPTIAKYLVEHFCPAGGLVFDPCAGYGGRAAGTKAAGRAYVGVDPHPKAGSAFRSLSEVVGSFDFHNVPIEEYDAPALEADLVLTSPPYFSAERYSEDPTQSWVRYSLWSTWVSKFLPALIRRVAYHLRLGGVFLLNVTDPLVSGKRVPLIEACTQEASKHDLHLEGSFGMALSFFGPTLREEPIFMFRRGKMSHSHPIPLRPPGFKAYPRKSTREGLTKERLEVLYLERLKTDAEIGRELGISDVTISQHRKMYDIPTMTPQERESRRSGLPSFSSLGKTALETLYQQMGDARIASRFGVSKTAVRLKRKKLGVETRRR